MPHPTGTTPRPPTAGPADGPALPFPLRLRGPVVKGFGRGSAELGIPTANIPISGLSVGGHEDVESGVYFGWAGLEDSAEGEGGGGEGEDAAAAAAAPTTTTTPGTGTVYPMVMSIGWNPFYKNSVRSVEVHLLHEFGADFYGRRLNLLIAGYIRPEYDYVSVEALIEDIRTDIEVARRSLGREAYQRLKGDAYLSDFGWEIERVEVGGSG